MEGPRFDSLLDYAATPLFFDMFLHATARNVWIPEVNPSRVVTRPSKISTSKHNMTVITEPIDDETRSRFLNRVPTGFDFPAQIAVVPPYRTEPNIGRRTAAALQAEWRQNDQAHREIGPSSIFFNEYSEELTTCVGTEVLDIVEKTGKGIYADRFDEEQFLDELEQPNKGFTVATVRCGRIDFEWSQNGRKHRNRGPQHVSLENVCLTSLNGRMTRYWYDKINYSWFTAENKSISQRRVKELTKQLEVRLDLLSANSVFRDDSDRMTFYSELIEVDSGRGSSW